MVESAVSGVPHPDFGEGDVAMLQPRLARFKQPKRILILQKLPGNAMGKVQKKGLRDLNAGLFSKS